MKKLLTIIFAFLAINLYSQTHTTVGDGTWADAATWDQTSYPNLVTHDPTLDNNDSIDVKSDITVGTLVFKNNSILYIAAGYTLTVDSMSILNNAILHVEGNLTVVGGVNMENNSSLDVDLSGGVDIGGSFEGGNNVDINVDGTMDIDGDITLGNGTEVSGDGDIYVDGDVDIPDGSDPGIVINPPLPINLIDFKAYKNNNNTILKWITASETNNDYFIIEYSNDAIFWNYLDEVEGNGNSYNVIEYEYVHRVDETYYYKLTQVDYDGKSETFKIIRLLEKSNDINPYLIVYTVYNLSGQIVLRCDNIEYIFENLKNGVYIITDGVNNKKIAIFN